MTSISISVRQLVEFLLRSGDIDNTSQGRSSLDSMQAGSRIHKKIQKAAGSSYEAEVRMSVTVPYENFEVCVEGRADGIITGKSGITVDEIKGTWRNLDTLKGPNPVHLAQAKCYAYMVLSKEELPEISVQVTYANLETEAVRRFIQIYTAEEITAWFKELMAEYGKWAEMEVSWQQVRTDSIAQMSFPFEYREGQEDLIVRCREAYDEGRFLFLEAPTGCGKTITTLYPAIEKLGEGSVRRIFYLTAKTITRTVAADTLNILRRNALRIKSIVLTAKEKICILKEPDCNPKACKAAGGHYDRINDALFDCLTSNEELSREVIEEYAAKHNVCPFEFSLDLSLFADVIVGDYNYVYDPHVYLRRFFAEGSAEKYLFLTDEAHNLVDRAREMYSASLVKEDMQSLAGIIRDECEGHARPQIPLKHAERIAEALDQAAAAFLLVKRRCDEGSFVYENEDEFAPQLKALTRFTSVVRKYLEEEEKKKTHGKLHKAVLNYYFDVSHFQEMWELRGDEYKLYARITEDEKFEVKLLCRNPGRLLRNCHLRAVGGVLFSATLFPMDYYKELLGGSERDVSVLAKSIFPEKNRRILVARDVTSRFDDRTDEMYDKIAGYIYRSVKTKSGNYMVFFPSFEFADRVYNILNRKYAPVVFDILRQSENMSETERESFLNRFRDDSARFGLFKRSVVGFCVLGGIFAEGIDLVGENLIGAVIVGGGIPFITKDRELIREYFDEKEGKGYEFAYQIPGINKVLQAAGRVIRNQNDKGTVLYLERRFLKPEYEGVFPPHMLPDVEVNLQTLPNHVASFWKSVE